MSYSETGRKIGLAIGISEYQDPKLPNLRFAKKDAEDVRAALLNPDIGVFEEITPLFNETKMIVSKAIEKLLKDAAVDDLILIYFSGHGKLNSKFELNLLLQDTDKDLLSSTALSFNFVKECINETKSKKIILILDCCHSGAAELKGDISNTLTENSGSGTFLLCATTGSNSAKEVEELENGIFTYFLLEGLKKGEADLGNDGLIDIQELFDYTSKKCNDEYKQVSVIKCDYKEKIVIGKNSLQIQENKFQKNVRKLVNIRKEFSSFNLYDEAMTILRKYHDNPLSLTEIEAEKRDCLDLLLSGEIKTATYVYTVLCLNPEEETAPDIEEKLFSKKEKVIQKQKEEQEKKKEKAEKLETNKKLSEKETPNVTPTPTSTEEKSTSKEVSKTPMQLSESKKKELIGIAEQYYGAKDVFVNYGNGNLVISYSIDSIPNPSDLYEDIQGMLITAYYIAGEPGITDVRVVNLVVTTNSGRGLGVGNYYVARERKTFDIDVSGCHP